jgi:hypothetical protein
MTTNSSARLTPRTAFHASADLWAAKASSTRPFFSHNHSLKISLASALQHFMFREGKNNIEPYHMGRLHCTGVHIFIPSIIRFWSMYYSRTKKRAVVGFISHWVLVTRRHGVLHCALVLTFCTTSQPPTIWANACHEQDRHGPERSRRTSAP